MTEPVADCPVHGYHTGTTCPACGDENPPVLSGRRRRRLSTFCSGALRHFPDDVGLTLDAAGWASVEELVTAVESKYDWAGEREVRAVVETDPKGRYERRERGGETEVRAAYGHSVDVDLDRDRDSERDGPAPTLPATLYHGTAPRNLDAILAEGVKPMGRQAVHLSGSPEDAHAVGRRHTDAEPVVLAVDVRGLTEAGHTVRKRGHDTYTVDRVPPEHLERFTSV